MLNLHLGVIWDFRANFATINNLKIHKRYKHNEGKSYDDLTFLVIKLE